jgi:biopolymer transport protein ExbD
MKKRFGKREKKEPVDLDITSLLDILVILLVFLLLNYNASDLELNLVKKIMPPDSESQKITHFAPVVQLNQDEVIYLDNKEVSRFPASDSFDDENRALSDYENALKERHKLLPEKEQKAQEGALINLVFDRDTNYEKVEKLMQASARVGFTQFKFIVRGAQ